ncbi:MAG: hypothetical protein H6851_15990 [Geminicoccaceae bacterium]|nr:hypothetical protein [Geminicoccaceae bacterium]
MTVRFIWFALGLVGFGALAGAALLAATIQAGIIAGPWKPTGPAGMAATLGGLAVACIPAAALLAVLQHRLTSFVDDLTCMMDGHPGTSTADPSTSFVRELDRVAHSAWQMSQSASDRQRQMVQLQERTERQLEEAHDLGKHLIEFSYASSHDLKAPANTVSALLGIVLEDYSTQIPRTALEHITNSIMLLDRMRTLVTDILQYAMLSDRRNFQMAPISLEELFTQLEEDMQEMISRHKAVIVRDPLPRIDASPVAARALFRNLLGNALKFCDKPTAIIKVGCERRDGAVVLSITDNGMGIDPEHHASVFDIFIKLHTFDEYPGTGLGLSLCRRIAQEHRWHIELRSEVGIGSTFLIHMPERIEP